MKRNKNDLPAWREGWISELDGHLPKLSESVRRAPIPQPPKRKKPLPVRIFERISSLSPASRGLIGALCCLILFVGIGIWFIPRGVPDVPPEPSPFVLTLEINPKVNLIIDKNGNVANATALNGDADIIIASQRFGDEVKGKPYAQAIAAYADIAIMYGYLDPSGDAVRITTAGGFSADGAEEELISYFKQHGRQVAVVSDSLPISEFITRAELSGQLPEDCDMAGIVSAASSLQPFFYKREADAAADAGELSELYRARLESDEVLEYLIKGIKDVILSSDIPFAEQIAAACEERLREGGEEITDRIADVAGIISELSAGLELINGISRIPESAEEYIAECKELNRTLAGDRLNRFGEIYAGGEPMEDGEYESFIAGIESEYGSLSLYFEYGAKK